MIEDVPASARSAVPRCAAPRGIADHSCSLTKTRSSCAQAATETQINLVQTHAPRGVLDERLYDEQPLDVLDRKKIVLAGLPERPTVQRWINSAILRRPENLVHDISRVAVRQRLLQVVSN